MGQNPRVLVGMWGEVETGVPRSQVVPQNSKKTAGGSTGNVPAKSARKSQKIKGG